jgi:hypothetical protein
MYKVPPMNWRREKPDKPGWYWAQEYSDQEPYVIYVDKKLKIFRDSLSRDLERIVLWLGPLPVPEL